MAATTLPLSFWIARACLAGVIRMLERRTGRWSRRRTLCPQTPHQANVKA